MVLSAGMTPFHLACEYGHLEAIKYLLSIESRFKTKIDINNKTKLVFHANPLVTACCKQHIHVVKYLIENVYNNKKKNELFKFNINEKTQGKSVFQFVVSMGDLGCIKAFVNIFGDEIDVNKKATLDYDETALHIGLFSIYPKICTRCVYV